MTPIPPSPAAATQNAAADESHHARRFGPVRSRVRCRREWHTISLSRRGRLTLHGHTEADLRREECLVALGGEGYRCVGVLRAWRANTNVNELPSGLRPAALAAREVREARRRAQLRTAPLAAATFFRRPGVIATLLDRRLAALAPGLSCAVTGPAHYLRYGAGEQAGQVIPELAEYGRYQLSVRSGDGVLLTTTVSERWAEQVRTKGLAFFCGDLTLYSMPYFGGHRGRGGWLIHQLHADAGPGGVTLSVVSRFVAE